MSNLEINSSPTSLSSGNKRLTKVPIFIVIVILVIFLFAIFYAALVRKQSTQRQASQETQEKMQTENSSPNTNNFLKALEESSKNKLKAEKKIEEEIKKEEVKKELSPTQLIPQVNNNSLPQIENPKKNVNDKELLLKKDLLLKALLSNSKLELNSEPKGKNINKSNVTGINDTNTNNSEKIAQEEFLRKTSTEGYLQKEKQKPISKYELKAGWIIPATLITGLNSDLPGEVLAQVSQNIYDTATGRYLLIPQGTKMVGNYSSNVIYGQERILTAWTKLIFPNGDTLSLDKMGGIDQEGYSGFSDQVDNHYVRIFGSAFLLSSITAGVALADGDNRGQEYETNSDKAISQAINQFSQVGAEIIRKNLNIAPTLEIRPGYKFSIFVTKDIILEPLPLKAER